MKSPDISKTEAMKKLKIGNNTLNKLLYEEKNKILSGIGTAIGNIGLIYSSNGQNKKADSCYKAALKIGKQINDKKMAEKEKNP